LELVLCFDLSISWCPFALQPIWKKETA